VLRVGDITDFGALKQAAVLLETTVTKLQSENAKLRLARVYCGSEPSYPQNRVGRGF
jgi:hypothetical protein